MKRLLPGRRGLGPAAWLLLSTAAACGVAGPGEGAGGGAPAPSAASAGRHEASLRTAFPSLAARVVDAGLALEASPAGYHPRGDADHALRLRLPRAAEEPVVMALSDGASLRVREDGAKGEAEPAGRGVAFARAGGSAYWTALAAGAEEWLRFEAGALSDHERAASWLVEGGELRQAGDAVEIAVDGAPRVRVTAPEAFTASGRAIRARLVASGPSIDLWVEGARGEAALVDPLWTAAGNAMSAPRSWLTLTVLANGKALAAGGSNSPANQAGSYESSANLYDPATNLWSLTGTMTTYRYRHAAALLPNGKALLAGGYYAAVVNGQQQNFYLATAELYDPGTGTFAPTPNMGSNRSFPTLTVLASGKVLAFGGYNGQAYVGTGEIYDPGTASWQPAGQANPGRRFQTATLLPSGKVLFTGGYNGQTIATSTTYDPQSGQWVDVAPLGTPRAHHTATLLGNGKVLIVGGNQETDFNPAAPPLATTELFDPQTQTFTPGPSMPSPAAYHTATLLPGGKVLVAGGRVQGAAGQPTAQLYDPATNTWATTDPMSTARVYHSAALLGTGKVLVVGGETADNAPCLASSELYGGGAANGVGCNSPNDCQSGYCVDGVCCDTACNQGACDACSVAAGAVVNGTCAGFSGKACNDGNACTQGDTCQAGVCVGVSNVACPGADACHLAGVCNPQSGQCVVQPKPNGTPCNDGNACTQNEACNNGACSAGQNVACQPLDACHAAGVCDPKTGACSTPTLPDGSPCEDGNLCTTGETCKAGACGGGAAKGCPAIDACHAPGVCEPGTGNCTTPAAVDGTKCDDGNACTDGDACMAGTCVGATPVACAPKDGCHGQGTCDPAQGGCVYPSAPDGSTCDDGDKCTAVDTCVAGTCTGAAAITCKPLDECHEAGTCAPATGVCSTPPKVDGTPCGAGVCTAGKCGPKPTGSGGGSTTGGGGGSTTGAGGGAATTDEAKKPLELSDTGGCGCRTAGEPGGDARWLVAIGAAAIVVARRRRR
jgi:MYXO-CTERM domain-containing protein